jgi:hypothetical protein
MSMADIPILRRLIATMEKGEDVILLGYFTEAIMWWDEDVMLYHGIEKEVCHNTTFYITPENGHVYLYHGDGLYLTGRAE